MFQLDDKFLADVGLDQLPDEQKKPFLQHIYDELELRVGTKLSEGMSDAQLEEFESIIDRKEEVVSAWLGKYVPNFQADPGFLQMQKATGLSVDDRNLRDEYAATKWLEVNRPDYRGVVADVMAALKQEVISNKAAILGQ